MSAPATDAWRPTTAFVVAVVTGLGLLVFAATTRRPGLALLAVPLLTEVAWALRRVRRDPVRIDVRPSVPRLREGDPITLSLDVEVPPDADVVTTLVEPEPLLATDEPLRPVCATPVEASRGLRAHAAHWGRHAAAQGVARAWTDHGLWQSPTAYGIGPELVVEPEDVVMAPLRPVPRAGVTGPRPARRTGSGSELTGVREFLPGDRLRHVHWRVTARRGPLHVTTTTSDREASLLLAVDSGSQFGARGTDTLDIAVRVATSLARVHLREGDRVGLVDLADPTRVLAPATGRRQLDRIVARLVSVRRSPPADLRRLGEASARTAPGALVVVLTPLLRPGVGEGVADLARRGADVVVVDTLPLGLDRRSLPAATRLWLLDRDVTADRLVDVGVPVRPWR